MHHWFFVGVPHDRHDFQYQRPPHFVVVDEAGLVEADSALGEEEDEPYLLEER